MFILESMNGSRIPVDSSRSERTTGTAGSRLPDSSRQAAPWSVLPGLYSENAIIKNDAVKNATSK